MLKEEEEEKGAFKTTASNILILYVDLVFFLIWFLILISLKMPTTSSREPLSPIVLYFGLVYIIYYLAMCLILVKI